MTISLSYFSRINTSRKIHHCGMAQYTFIILNVNMPLAGVAEITRPGVTVTAKIKLGRRTFPALLLFFKNTV
jgi:hypothetical protein